MVFTKDNQLVKSYVLLIDAGRRTFDSVPDVSNLREVIAEELGIDYSPEPSE